MMDMEKEKAGVQPAGISAEAYAATAGTSPEQFAAAAMPETLELLRTLARIPAPSHKEERRAQFCRDWLVAQGAKNVEIDAAKNVVCPIPGESEDVVVIMAHTDVVFADEEELPLREENGKMYAPGVGDDTANLVNLLMSVKYLLKNGCCPRCTLLFVANACEEGLGNLKGSRQIWQDWGPRIREWISYDCNLGECINRAVGSYRYRVTVRTVGGHSYSNFGRDNAIAVLAELIHDLYRITPPTEEKTTYNVGVIEGGSTVNSIAERASMLYEFRSASQECLRIMEEKFRALIDGYRRRGFDVEVEVLGIRPGNGPVDEERLRALTAANLAVIEACFGGPVKLTAGSTDANIPLSVGVPANTFGTVTGGLAHTREEWIEPDSMKAGLLVAVRTALRYCTPETDSPPPQGCQKNRMIE